MIKLFSEKEFEEAKSQMLLPLKCEHCGKKYFRTKREILYEENHQRGRCRFCSQECRHLFYSTQYVTVKCENCGKEKQITLAEYNKSKTKHFFCNRSCSATYNNSQRKLSEETKTKISNSLQDNVKRNFENKMVSDNLKILVCKNCGKEYVRSKVLFPTYTKICCCKECSKEYREIIDSSAEYREKLSIAGRKSVSLQGDIKRSKNEIMFCKLCEKHFGNVKHNEPLFNGWDADVILENEKIAILWNGIWHYKKVHEGHKLEQTQNRDKIKLNEIQKCGYKPYVIKDMGKYNPKFVESEFEKFLTTYKEILHHIKKNVMLPQSL